MSQKPRPDRRPASSPRSDLPGVPPGRDEEERSVPRLFLREPGWQVGLKVGSEKTHCYMTAPGEDHYHRIADGEIFLYRGDLRLCLPCAARHGLLHSDPKGLRPPIRGLDVAGPSDVDEYPLRDAHDRPLSKGAPDDLFLS